MIAMFRHTINSAALILSGSNVAHQWRAAESAR
jgi:hypothetical protein